ncbi:hypothetical protein SUDANB19_03672 [Streptomyces sp. enrichment culture]
MTQNPPARRAAMPGCDGMRKPIDPTRSTALMKAAAGRRYLVDEATEQAAPPSPPWVGRVLQEHPDGTVQLITPTGYAWTAPATCARPPTPSVPPTTPRYAASSGNGTRSTGSCAGVPGREPYDDPRLAGLGPYVDTRTHGEGRGATSGVGPVPAVPVPALHEGAGP